MPRCQTQVDGDDIDPDKSVGVGDGGFSFRNVGHQVFEMLISAQGSI